MEKFDVHILGCGSAIPTAKHLPTSQVVDLRDKLFMIDCAEGAQLQLRRQKLKFSRLNHIFLSHLHGDHCFGLIGLFSTFDLLGRTSKLHVYSPGDDLERLMRPWLDYFCRGMSYEVVFHAVKWKEHQVVYEDRTLTVETLPLKHRVPCCGYLFREKAPLPHIRRDMIDFLKIPFHAVQHQGRRRLDGRKRQSVVERSPRSPRRTGTCLRLLFRHHLSPRISRALARSRPPFSRSHLCRRRGKARS